MYHKVDRASAAFGHRPGSIYGAAEADTCESTSAPTASATTRNKQSTTPQAVPPPSSSPLDEQPQVVTSKKRTPMQLLQYSSHAVIVVTVLGVAFAFFDNSLFSWHPTLMTLGFVGFMAEGVKTAIRFRSQEGPERVASIQKHAAWQIGMLVSVLGGFYAIYLNKVKHGKQHFTTLHSRFGALTLMLSVVVPLAGALAFKSLGLLQRVPEAYHARIKLGHRRCGTAAFFLALTTAFLGLSTPSVYKGVTTHLLQMLVLALTALVADQLLKQPSVTAREHLDAASKLV